MQKEEKYQIIKGEFESSDVKSILFNFLTNKIKFHEMRNFSSLERNGQPDEISLNSIERLSQIKDQVDEIILEAEKLNKRLNVLAELNIQIID
jgi:uncharacterized membrane protein YjjP (DUF1212 family)